MDHLKSENFGELLSALAGRQKQTTLQSPSLNTTTIPAAISSAVPSASGNPPNLGSVPMTIPISNPVLSSTIAPQVNQNQMGFNSVSSFIPQHQHLQVPQYMWQGPQQYYQYPVAMGHPAGQPINPVQEVQLPVKSASAIPPAIPAASVPQTSQTTVKKSTGQSFFTVFIIIFLFLLAVSVLVAWYFWKKNSLLSAASLAEGENESGTVHPKLFMHSQIQNNDNISIPRQTQQNQNQNQESGDKEDREDKEDRDLVRDEVIIENLKRYLASSESENENDTSQKRDQSLKASTMPKNTRASDTTSSSHAQEIFQKQQRIQKFTKLSEVIVEDSESDHEDDQDEDRNEGLRDSFNLPDDEVVSEKKQQPRRIDSESPEISEFMKKREKAEKENLKWLESQRESGQKESGNGSVHKSVHESGEAKK
jgi:hypothetical protein